MRRPKYAAHTEYIIMHTFYHDYWMWYKKNQYDDFKNRTELPI